ncbi:MAG: glycosyltransferase family 2 protein [Tunicatimonas sp.]
MSTPQHPLISVITLNYNQTKVTGAFLRSLRSATYPNLEVIVVDNNSEVDPTSEIKREYPAATVIRSPKNLGFTGGNNLGMKESSGEYVFIVNNDTEVTESIFERMLEGFSVDARVGVVSPKIRYYDQPDRIQFAGFTEINPFTGRNRGIAHLEVDQGQHDQGSFSPYAHGAAMLVKREVIDTVGVFPELFFIYYEELDWSSQITRAGYKIYYQPTALIFHKESITMGRESAIKAYYHNRNRILFMRRNFRTYQLLCFYLFFLGFTTPKTIAKYVFRRQWKHLRSFGRALAWNIRYRNPAQDRKTNLQDVAPLPKTVA